MAHVTARRFTRGATVALALFLSTSCERQQPADEPAADSSAAPAENPQIGALRTKFQPLTDFAQAAPAGYSEAITPCWYHRVDGGQGEHYGKTALIDSVVTDMDPELVMYEPQQGGGKQLVGIEYIVPFDQWKSPNPPMALGMAMHRNEVLSLWVMHVWLFRENPKGLYNDWNPTVSCANAPNAEDRAPPAA